MPTVAAVLRKSKVNRTGTAPVYLRFSDVEKTVFKATGIRVKPADWNERKGLVRKSNDDYEELNAEIKKRIAAADLEKVKLLGEQRTVKAEELREATLPPEPGMDFFAYAESVARDFEARGAILRMYKIKLASSRLREIAKSPLPFERLTPALLRAYETHLLTKHENHPNTVRGNLAALRSVLYRAIREGYAEQAHNPFFSFKPIGHVRPERDKLTADELRAIEALPLDTGSLLWRIRAQFLFSFYCAGIRFGDLARLRWEHVTEEAGGHLRLTYRMSKTSGLKSLRLLPQARAILDGFPQRDGSPYLFPILDGYDLSTPRRLRSAVSAQTALANKYLKKIGARAEVACKLSTHIARHSFADIARQRGWDVYTISKALGHANIKVTENYLKGFDSSALDEKMHDLFGQTDE